MVIKEYPHTDGLLTSRFDTLIGDKPQPRAVTVNGVEIPPYIPSKDLKELVRLAQIIKRPILVKGDPGSGKTEFARSVAYEWYGAEYENYFFKWVIKSTSKAVDGLYSFDHISRLRDAQLAREYYQAGTFTEDKLKYRSFGPMGLAFQAAVDELKPPILLIDEIDKADIDFPNDLLLELDKYEFTIPETEETIKVERKNAPIIFITSNAERELPDAFLRRCLFSYIKFPDDEQLAKIIKAQLPLLFREERGFVDNAIARFKSLRDKIRRNPMENKQVSTSELLDWLSAYNFDLSIGEMSANKNLDDLPSYHHALLKTYASLVAESKIRGGGIEEKKEN